MSGGHWEYIQYRFTDIAEDIDKIVEQNGKAKSEEKIVGTMMIGIINILKIDIIMNILKKLLNILRKPHMLLE